MSHPVAPEKLRKGAAWVVGCRLTGIAATLAGNILVARLLGPAQFGLFLLISTVISCGAVLAMAGLNEAGLRFIAESLAHGRLSAARAYLAQMVRMLALATPLAVLLITICLVFFHGVTARAQQPLLLVGLTAVGLALLAWQTVAAETLRGFHDLRAASLFSGGQGGGPLANLVFLGILALIVALRGRLEAIEAIAALVGSMTLTFPLVLTSLWWTTRKRTTAAQIEVNPLAAARDEKSDGQTLSVAQRRELFTVAGTLLSIQLLSFASQQFDVWIGGALLSETDLGLYGAAKRSLLLAAMPVQMAMLTVVSSIPHLYALGRRDELQQLLRRSATWAAIPSLAALAALIVFPQPLLSLVFGSSYVEAAPAIWALAAGHLALILCGNPIHVMAMTGFHRTALVVNALATGVLVIAGPLGALWYGAPGLAAAASASLAVQNGLLWILARRQAGVWTNVGLLPRTLPSADRPETISNPAIKLNES